MEDSSNSDERFDRENVLVTPYQKQVLLKSEIQPLDIDLPLSSDGDNSFVASMNEGCESPLSSWDSEPETDITSVINYHDMPKEPLKGIKLKENYLDIEEQNKFVGVENTDDGLLWEMDNRSYDDLLKKFMEKEEELRFSNFRLQLSEQEIIKLNVQVENSEAQLDNVREELKLKEKELNKQNELSAEEIFKLKIQTENSEARLYNVREELKLKEEELNKLKELSEEEIFKLKIQIEKSDNRLDNVCEELKLKEEEMNKLKELSEEEIFKLKIQFEKSENQLDNVQEELNLKVEKLQKQIDELDTHIIPEFSCRITNLMEQLEVAHEKELEKKSIETHQLQGQLKVAQENMAKSELELVSNREQIQMLVDSVIMYECKATNHEQEVQKLKSEMLDLQAKFSLEKDEMHFDIASLSKLKIELTSKLEDCQSRNKELENKLSRDRDAKVEQEIVLEEEINCLREELGQNMLLLEDGKKELEMAVIEKDEANAKNDKLEAEICSCNDKFKLHATQQMVLQEEINCLREELGQKMYLVEAANKELEMLVIERDEANAKIDKLEDDICSCNDKLSNTEEYIKELKASLKEMTVAYKTNRNEIKMLKLRLEELKEEVTRQNGVISDKDEEKREAIRQLCYSLEHYRSRYRELVQAINKVYRGRYGHHGHVIVS